jgi:antitoxin ParD1/3/4
MPSADAITISLTPELRRFIEAQVATGRYQTASEVVRAGLRLLTKEDPPQSIQPSGKQARRVFGKAHSK